MNTAKWDAIAESFERGEFVPANGWDEWNAQAIREAVMIREALPQTVDTLLEVGCGVGRLTPHLARMFPHVIANDTSAACRRVTVVRLRGRPNVRVVSAAGAPYGSHIDAAVVWGNLHDADWTTDEASAHARALMDAYPTVLFSTPTPPLTIRTGESLTSRDTYEVGANGDHWAQGAWLRFEQP